MTGRIDDVNDAWRAYREKNPDDVFTAEENIQIFDFLVNIIRCLEKLPERLKPFACALAKGYFRQEIS